MNYIRSYLARERRRELVVSAPLFSTAMLISAASLSEPRLSLTAAGIWLLTLGLGRPHWPSDGELTKQRPIYTRVAIALVAAATAIILLNFLFLKTFGSQT